MAAPTNMAAPVQPMLHAASLGETMRFYRDALGFVVQGTWPEGTPTWCALASGPAQLMFTSDASEGTLASALTGSIYFYPADVDGFFAALPTWVRTITAPRDEPWGMREFALEDPNGYLLKFGRPVLTS